MSSCIAVGHTRAYADAAIIFDGTPAGLAALLNRLPESERYWWSPHVHRGSPRDCDQSYQQKDGSLVPCTKTEPHAHRRRALWRGVCAVAQDLDLTHPNTTGAEGHVAWDADEKTLGRLRQLEANLDRLPGNVWYRTRRGLRLIYMFDRMLGPDDAELFRKAASGATAITETFLRSVGLAWNERAQLPGLIVDRTVEHDLARLLYTPHTLRDGVRMPWDAHVLEPRPYPVEILARAAPPERVKPVRQYDPSAPKSELQRAIERFNEDYGPLDIPRENVRCPMCGKDGGPPSFKMLPGTDNRWICRRQGHLERSGGYGFRTSDGTSVVGTAIDLVMFERSLPRKNIARFLRSETDENGSPYLE